MNEAIESTLIYRSFYNAFKVMPEDERNLLLNAILAYSFEGIEPDFTSHPWAQSVFEGIRPNIDNRNDSVVNGKKGGRPQKETPVSESEKGGFSENEKGGFENSKTNTKAKAEANTEAKANAKAKAEAEANFLKDSCSELNSDPPSDVEAIILNDGSEWVPTESELEEYERLYPAVDVRKEFANMRGWCIGNPSKRKTRSGVKRFVASWLSKEQNRSKGRDAPQDRYAVIDEWYRERSTG